MQMFVSSSLFTCSMIILVLFVSVNSPQGSKLEDFQRNVGSVWVKIVSSWLCFALYLWTILAPICFPNRDFSSSFAG